MKNKLIIFLATAAYVGLLPKAPGTFGTLWGILLAYLEGGRGFAFHGAFIIAITAVSIYISGQAELIIGKKDPGEVVCDEVAGVLVAFFLLPFTAFNAILVFILFRIFDILKPYPVSFLDRTIKGGTGIVLDDIAAGIYANIAVHVILLILSRA